MSFTITPNWVELIPAMINQSRRKGVRIPEYEPIISQSPSGAADYASVCIKGLWPEAEDVIATDANASYHYAIKVVNGRWEKGEAIISTDANFATMYAKNVLRAPFPLGEAAIATNCSTAFDYARCVLNSRFILGEPAIAKTETEQGVLEWVKRYYDLFMNNPSSWSSWTTDQLKVCPCWMYMYAKDCLKGRLPDVLHNHMTAFGMTLKDDYYVKKYFKAKRYQKKVKYRRKKKFNSLADEVAASIPTED